MAEVKRVQNVPGRSIHTMKLIEYLEPRSTKGNILADEELSEVIGMSTRTGDKGYAYLVSAIRYVNKEKQVHWVRIRGANAIKCLMDGETLDDAGHKQKSIHRKSRAIMQSLHTVNTSALSDGDKTKHNTLCAQVGTLVVFSSANATKKLEARQIAKPLEIGRALEAMK
jgi:hypothetical protein